MSKNLFIVRHATAEDIGNLRMVRDFDRQLVSRGIMEAAKVGKFLTTYFCGIEEIVTSGAIRAYSTAKYIAEQLKFDTDQIKINDLLYGSGPRGYLSALHDFSPKLDSVLMVGHNPDITYFGDYLSEVGIEGGMKKATLIHLRFENLNWGEISQDSGRLMKRIDVANIDLS